MGRDRHIGELNMRVRQAEQTRSEREATSRQLEVFLQSARRELSDAEAALASLSGKQMSFSQLAQGQLSSESSACTLRDSEDSVRASPPQSPPPRSVSRAC